MEKDYTVWAQDFYDEVEPIRLRDPLAEFLGAIREGEPLVYGFKEAVLTAGHSCPAVAGAFKVTALALKSLYKDEMPVRGEIKVLIKGSPDQLAYGPQSQVITLITGAATEAGFKGLGGRFSRKGKLVFDSDGFEFNTYIFQREDTGAAVKIVYSPQVVEEDPLQAGLMPVVMSGEATDEEAALFKKLWQDKIRKILIQDDLYPGLLEIEELSGFEFPSSADDK